MDVWFKKKKKLDNIRINYINIGTKEKEIWKPVPEFAFKTYEIILNPKS